MLTKRQNFMETITGGNPDRFVNQYEFLRLFRAETPYYAKYPMATPGQESHVDGWGITWSWREGQPGVFPVHTPDKIVIKDIENWRDYVHAPQATFSDEDWAACVALAETVDREEEYVAAMVTPGVFEMCHHLMEIQNCLVAFYENPDEMHELIDYITAFELERAQDIVEHLHPDAIFHHDDWGTQQNTFLSPDMWREFIKPAYEKIYGFYKANGVEIIVHHSDSYAATLVPDMIDVGIDVWQGTMTCNDIPALIAQYGGRISFMGGIDSAQVDFPGWTREIIREQVRRACDENGRRYFIPCIIQGGPMSTYPGVYDATSEEIARYSKEVFSS